MKKINVVVFSYYLEDTRVRKQCELLASHGYEVNVLCLKRKNELENEVYNRVNIKRVGTERKADNRTKLSYLSEYLKFFISAAMWNISSLFKGKAALTIVHNMPNFLVFSALPSRLCGVPTLLDTHDLMPELWTAMGNDKSLFGRLLLIEEKLSHKFSTHVMTVNKTLAAYLNKRNLRKYTVFHNGPIGMDIAPYSPSDSPSLVYHGNIHERYGLQNVVTIMPKLIRKYPDIKLDIHGYGPYANDIKQLISELGLEKHCIMHGRFAPENVPAILKGKTIGFATIDKCQQNDLAIPVKVLEYISNGIPSICTSLDTMHQYFPDTAMCYLYNPEDLFSKVCQLLDSNELRQKQVYEAQNQLSEISWRKESKLFLEYIEKIQR